MTKVAPSNTLSGARCAARCGRKPTVPKEKPVPIGGKVVTYAAGERGFLHKVCVWVRRELTGQRPGVPLSPIDVFAAHLPDAKPGFTRRLLRARTNRAGTVLVALVHDSKH